MARFLHTLSAILFYILGFSYFLMYILQNNKIAVVPSQLWLYRGMLPLLCVALLYGGLSIYLSLTQEQKPSRPLAMGIAAPLAIMFVVLVVLKFWHTV